MSREVDLDLSLQETFDRFFEGLSKYRKRMQGRYGSELKSGS
jgi:hypothetical protein